MGRRWAGSLAAVCALVAATLGGVAHGSAATPVMLHREGQWLVDAQGRTVILHGVNAVWKRAPYYPPATAAGFTAKDADWLVANGFNSVRLGVIFEGVMPRKGFIDQGYLTGIERTVKLLTSRKIWVLLDFHQDLYSEEFNGEGFPQWAVDSNGLSNPVNAGFPGNYFLPATSRAFDNFWHDTDGYQELYAKAWAAVAKRFNGYDYILGYDLFNEPWPGTQFALCVNPVGCPTFDVLLHDFYEKVIAQIRTVDTRRIVWLEPNVLFNDGVATRIGTGGGYTDKQLGLSWHQYCTVAGLTHSSGGKAGPDCDVQGNLLVAPHVRTALKDLGTTGLLTEFGASDDLKDIQRVTKLADSLLSGWEYWHYKEWGDPTTESADSGGQGLFTKDNDLSTLKQAKANILIRAYPQAVSGTLSSMDQTGVGSSFGYLARPGVTQIVVPRHQFPHGYKVRFALTAGSARPQITSASNAQVLTIRTRGSGPVYVSVLPPDALVID